VVAQDETGKPARSAGRRSAILWWANTLLEVTVLFAIIVTAELLLGDGKIGSFLVHPHPYWLIVIPMAAARGAVAGLVSATIATALYLFGAQTVRQAATIESLLTLNVMLEPILFYGVGFLVGEFRDVVADRNRDQAKRLSETQELADRMRQQRDVLADANRILEKRLVDHTVQFGNLLTAATRIEQATDRRGLYEIALELIEEHCGAGASVLLPLPDGSVDLLCHRGWSDKEAPERLEEARASEFVRRAIEDGTDVNGFALDETPPESGPLVVSTLVGSNGVIEALLALDTIPASRLNNFTIRTFFAIGEWISAAISRQESVRTRRADGDAPLALEISSNRLGTPFELGRRLRVEYERCTRYGVPLSVLTIQFTEWTDATPSGIKTVDSYVVRHFTGNLRSSDGVYRFPHPGCYLILLPATPLEGGEVVKERLLRRVKHSLVGTLGKMRMEVTGPDPYAPDAENLVERCVERFRAESALPLAREMPLDLPRGPWIGGLQDFVRTLRGEVTLSTRWEFPMQILDLVAPDAPEDADPGLLALHLEQIAGRALRTADTCYCVGRNHVSVILPHTENNDAQRIEQRLLDALAERAPDPPYGEIDSLVLGFGAMHPNVESFLESMAGGGKLEIVDLPGGGS